MAKHHIMDATGHSTVEFDKANTVDLDAAMKRFAALTGADDRLADINKNIGVIAVAQIRY